MRIDAHQHYWKLSRGDYGWLTPDLTVLYKDFLPEDLLPELNRANVDGTILVQAAPTIEETHFILKLAKEVAEIKGVVGWVDFESPTVLSDIDTLAADEHLVGLRPMIQDIPDPHWMLKPQFSKVFDHMSKNNLAFDALVLPKHLESLHQLLERHPCLVTIINHAAKPEIRNNKLEDWKRNIGHIAKNTQAFCKVSGLTTEASKDWRISELRPYADVLMGLFGAERLIWGSDWPVCLLATDYEEWVRTCEHLFTQTGSDMNRLFGENAAKAYGLNL